MKLVLDANIIFSCLLSGNKFYIDLLTQNQCFSPDFIFEEIRKYEDKILNKTGLKVNFKEFAKEIFTNLIIIPKIAIESESWKTAYDLCKDVDEKDTAYIALAIELDLPLLTRDKKLYKSLKLKDFENVVLLEKLLENYGD